MNQRENYEKLCIQERFFPLIIRPTRIISNTATLIDNIFTNNLNNFSVSGLMFCDISDFHTAS